MNAEICKTLISHLCGLLVVCFFFRGGKEGGGGLESGQDSAFAVIGIFVIL